jgi:carboxylesterase type B
MLIWCLGYAANMNANINGAEVVQKSGHSIVAVSFNYRVSLWGFLASERVRDDGALNAGLLDQRMLMKWVQKHIASVCPSATWHRLFCFR